MATPAGLLQTILGAFAEYSKVLQPTNRAMDYIDSDVSTVAATVGAVVNVPVSVPVDSQVVNQSGLAYVASTYNSYGINFVPLSLQYLLRYSLAIPSIDTINTPQDIKRVLMDPGMKALENQADRNITAMFTTANFAINPAIVTTNGIVTTKQFVAGKDALDGRAVDTTDPTNMVFLQHNTPYNATLTDDAWTRESAVGINVAEDARLRGINRVAYGSAIAMDQQMPASGAPGSKTFTSILMARQAMMSVYRPVPAGDAKFVDAAYVAYKGLPILIEVSYLGKDEQYYINMKAAMGVAVIRPDMGQIFTTAQ